jgi:hypothetical protein
VTCEPEFGQHFLECPDAWRHVFKLDRYQQGEFGEMKDTIPAASKDDDLVPDLFQEFAPRKRSHGRSEKFLPGDVHVAYHRGP